MVCLVASFSASINISFPRRDFQRNPLFEREKKEGSFLQGDLDCESPAGRSDSFPCTYFFPTRFARSDTGIRSSPRGSGGNGLCGSTWYQ